MWLQDHICFGRRYSRVRVTHNPQSSPTAMTAPLQGAYKVSEKRNLELLNTFISPLKGEVDASKASRRKGWDTLCSRFVNNFQFT